jgi:hypothetical protein
MSTSQRVSRGFHRLGLFLAAILLLVGGTLSVIYALDEAGPALAENPTPNIQIGRHDDSSVATPSGGKTLTIDGVCISPAPQALKA